MKVLVTGATGFVGSHAVEALLGAGHDVRVLVRRREKLARVFEACGIEVPEAVVGDMADAAAVSEALSGCDAVLHAAAQVLGPARLLARNAAGVRHVLGTAHELGLDPIVHVSSIGALFPPREPAFRVDDPVGSVSTDYGRSKAEGESFARSLQAADAPVVTIYPSSIFGPRDPGPSELIRGLRTCIRVAWPWTHTAISIVDVRDLAQIFVAVLEPGRGPRRYMAGGHLLSFVEQAQLFERLTGTKLLRVPTSPFLLRIGGRLLDVLRKGVPIGFPLSYEAAVMLQQNIPCDSRATLEQLAVDFRPVEETFADTLRWMLEVGHIEPRHAGRLA